MLNLSLTLVLSLQPLFDASAQRHEINPLLLEGVCRFESDHGRVKRHKNYNGSWDVGFCMNHRAPSKHPPRIPNPRASIKEAAWELAYWKQQHRKYCVRMLNQEGRCGKVVYGKWRGVSKCWRPHPYYAHYNHGFRVLKNGYAKRVACYITNGFKRCKKRRWQKINF